MGACWATHRRVSLWPAVSRILFPIFQPDATISLGRTLPPGSSSLPADVPANRLRDGRTRCELQRAAGVNLPRLRLFGLAAGGVCLAAEVTSGAVRSYRTFSPLPGGMLNDEY